MMKLEKVTMNMKNLKTTPSRGNAGFTAIEIAMVAAVIAILSLIVLPIFRNRVEDAKIAAAQADLEATLNCGVGMVALVAPDTADAARERLAGFGIDAWVAGEIAVDEEQQGTVELVGQHPGW